MKRKIALAFAFCLAAAVLLASIPPYDKNGDPFKDLSIAKKTAKAEGKRILVFAGGPWCDWCARLDNFLKADQELTTIIDRNYVVMKVYVEKDLTPNGLFLAKFPSAPGFPHIYVLNSEGQLLISQKTDVLEKGEGYDNVKVKEFLENYALKK
jgi:thioredoxin-related protein